MKKIIFAISIILLLLLSACSSAAPTTEISDPSASSTLIANLANQNLTASAPVTTQTPSETGTIELNTTYENAVTIEMQLLLGTLKLEGTELAVTTEQANVLIPLWTNFKTLSESMMPAQGDMRQGQPSATPQPQTVSTETQAQIDELTKQIQAAMTSDQIKAIVAMQITQETAQSIMQKQGLVMDNPQQGTGNGGQPPQGDMPQGTPPAGGLGGQPPSGNQMGTPPADGMQRGMGMISPMMIDGLLKILQEKTG